MIEVKVSPIDAQEIWSFESGYNFVTFNGGASWEAFGEFTKMGKVQINGFEFDELNKNIVYFSAGGEEPALYRFDKSTKGYTQLRTCGNSFAVSQGKTKKFATMDGGWTWTSFRPKLEEVMNTPEVYLGNASIWVMNYVGNVINLQIYYDSKSYQVVSSDNGQSWTINK